MRRLVPALTVALLLTLLVSSPALAMFHNQITNPFLHMLADVGIVAALATPLVVAWYRLTARRSTRR